jgi:hypothetical protein
MDESNPRDERIAAVRRHATEFLDRLRKIEPDLLIELVIEMQPERARAGFKLEIKEGLPPLPFDKAPFDKAPPFKDAPFRDNPWHDKVQPPDVDTEDLSTRIRGKTQA